MNNDYKRFMKVLFFLTVFSSVLFGGFRWYERSNLYYPTRKLHGNPSDLGMKYEDVYFNAEDGTKLHGWFLPEKNADFTILLCHGNAGNVSDRLMILSILKKIPVQILIFDYRGYGLSQGTPDEKGFYKDAKAAYNHLIDRGIDQNKIVPFGRSLGVAVATNLCSYAQVAGVILDSGFTSTPDLAAKIYPFLPVKLFMKTRYNSLELVPDINVPKLFIHSWNDEIIPFSHAESLYKAAAEPKKLLKIRGSHNEAFVESEKDFKKGIKEFLQTL